MKKLLVGILMVGLMLSFVGNVSAQKPSRSDFTLVVSELRKDITGGTWIYGELTNNGAVAAGAEICVSVYDKGKKIIDSASFWPYSTKNLDPGESCAVKYPITDDSRIDSIKAKVCGVNVWKD